MDCIRCIKRLFCSDYSQKEYEEEEEEEEFFITPNPMLKEETPLTMRDISETSMFKKITEWSETF